MKLEDDFQPLCAEAGEEEIFKIIYPSWDGGRSGPLFMNHEEPLSDPIEALKEAIEKHTAKDDVVLCTPLQAQFFEDSGIERVSVFDISRSQLISLKIKDKFLGKNRSYWWLDLFDKDMLKEALREVNPSVFFISNIVEWADSYEKIDRFIETLLEAEVKSVMFSAIIYGSRYSTYFIRAMEELGWSLNQYRGEKGLIGVFVRPETT